MNTKICISISTYDAFEDINLSANILRSNWNLKEELYLIAGLCKKDSSKYLNKGLFDSYINIEPPKTHLTSISSDESSFDSINARLFNSFIKTGIKAIENKCDYILYLNSGSWILKPEKILDLISDIKNNTVGVRVMSRFKYLLVEDHFFIINLKKAKNYDLFNVSNDGRIFNTFSAPINGIHGILRAWINSLPYGEVFVYCDHMNSYDELGQSPVKFNPLIFDKKYYFLHSNKKYREVKMLRSIFLQKYLKNKNNFIKEFILQNNKLYGGFTILTKPIPHLKITLFRKILYFITFGKRGIYNKIRRWPVKIKIIDNQKYK